MIRGILLEGTDYVGKTSVARALVARLEARGIPVQHGKCYRSDGPLIRELERLAKLDDTVEGRDWLYSAALLVDLALAPPPDRFLVQERHWFSQLARNRYFHPERVMIPEDALRRLHTPFECQVYLTSDIETKRQRSSGRPPASPRDRVLAGDPATHQAFDEASIALLPADERWTVLDTSRLTVDAIADQILDELPCAPW